MYLALRLIAPLLLFSFALPAIAQEDEAVSLRPVFVVGHNARYEDWGKQISVTTISAQGESQDVTTVLESTAEVSWTVDRIEADGSAWCTYETHWHEITMTIEDQAITISSRNPTGDVPAFDELIQASVDHPLRVHISADGTVLAIEGGQAIRDALGELAELASSDEELMQQAKGVAYLPAIPDALMPGAGWADAETSEINVAVIPQLLSIPAAMNETVSYTLEGVGEIEGVSVATVSVSSRGDLEPDFSELPEELPPVDVRLIESSRSGEVLIDLSRHEIVATNAQGSYTVQASLTGPDGQTLTSRTTVTSQSQSLRVAEDE